MLNPIGQERQLFAIFKDCCVSGVERPVSHELLEDFVILVFDCNIHESFDECRTVNRDLRSREIGNLLDSFRIESLLGDFRVWSLLDDFWNCTLPDDPEPKPRQTLCMEREGLIRRICASTLRLRAFHLPQMRTAQPFSAEQPF